MSSISALVILSLFYPGYVSRILSQIINILLNFVTGLIAWE